MDHMDVYPHVIATLERWTNDGKSFTALDVTKHLNTTVDYNIDHYTLVRPAVHAIMLYMIDIGDTDYEFDLRDYGAPERAWTYHPKEEPVNWIPVDSTAVSSIGYNLRERKLHVEFVGGGRYAYSNVEPKTFILFLNADSHGEFINKVIKPGHACDPK